MKSRTAAFISFFPLITIFLAFINFLLSMGVEEIRNICLALPCVTESIKWEDHLCFSVGDKMFVVINPDTFPISASFKTSDTLFDELPTREGIIPAPYMARYKWVHIDNINRLTSKEWNELIEIAYHTIVEKLPAKIRKKIASLKDKN